MHVHVLYFVHSAREDVLVQAVCVTERAKRVVRPQELAENSGDGVLHSVRARRRRVPLALLPSARMLLLSQIRTRTRSAAILPRYLFDCY